VSWGWYLLGIAAIWLPLLGFLLYLHITRP
jgi:hypothetical protein